MNLNRHEQQMYAHKSYRLGHCLHLSGQLNPHNFLQTTFFARKKEKAAGQKWITKNRGLNSISDDVFTRKRRVNHLRKKPDFLEAQAAS